ncbi:SDR family NAD(P)-dependent oxidoreductase [Bradyrhizobium sp. Gha]|uniref:SDR family NAD(P)-dependent oxidoreductase n=1 Tax=Bradyrhizobium sp. Gha TaxID=1855318 RepID=UPI0008E0323D|nr:SDR family NAD(P)-dependent oxidoreductase [Bradyrhizobium sp. Gha]SFI95085.1 NAD(P)-dependent dehydrogenase, short-chain alcohol dehydrogenase family [Bradyrhizobium sp. Gha]
MPQNGFNFTDKTMLVTGAGSGIGRAVSMAFSEAGARVIVTDHDGDAAEAVASKIRSAHGDAIAKPLDVGDLSAASQLAESLKKEGVLIAGLVNNAGIAGRSVIGGDQFTEQFRRIFEVNVHGVVNVTQAFLPHLRESRGTIVNVASIQSFVALPFRSSAYTTSKGAVAQFTKASAVELAEFGIRVNAVAPGLIETPLTLAARRNPDYVNYFLERTPLRRVGKPGDVADAAMFLSSDIATYITGVVLPVDGGLLAL